MPRLPRTTEPCAMNAVTRRHFLTSTAAAAGLSTLPAASVSAPADETKPKFRLGLVTYNLAASWALNDLLKACKDSHVSPVEFRTTHKHGVEPSLSKSQRQEVRKKCADAEV